MTDKTRAPRNSAPLTAHSAIGKIRAIYADQGRRIADLKFADDDKARAIVDRVEGAKESEALTLMLDALNIYISAPDTIAAESTDFVAGPADDVPSRPAIEEYAEPRGVTEYVPGPAAQAARGRR
jgi:hypothetical protein